MSLAIKTVLGFLNLAIVMGAALFLAAWTFDFWEAWTYVAIFLISSSLITLYLWRNDRKLLERRVKAGPTAEKENAQKVIQIIASIAFFGLLIVPSLDHKYGWSFLPLMVVIAGDLLVALGFFIVFLVFRANTFTSATIEVSEHQQVISTGLYAVVRHPMYSGALVLLAGTPLALGSWYGLFSFAPMVLAIIMRLLNEERFLGKNLAEYSDYCGRVPYRLIPFIW